MAQARRMSGRCLRMVSGSVVLFGHVAHLWPAMGFQQAGMVAQQRVYRLLDFVLILGPNVAVKPCVEVFGRVSIHHLHV